MTSLTDGLSAEQVQFFKDNGYVGPFDLYEPGEAQRIWSKAMIEMALSKNKPHNSTIINYDRHLDCDTLSEHISRPEIVNKLRSLLGEDIICWKSNIFQKQPGDAGTGWHQVEKYIVGETTTAATPSLNFAYSRDDDTVLQDVSVWTAFSPARRENGCMRFIRGSQKRWFYDENKRLHKNPERKTDFFGYDYSELQLDPSWDPEKDDVVDMEMEPGQFVLFVEKCVHGSLPNISDQTRLGYASRYVIPQTKVYEHVDKLVEFGDEISLDYHGCVLVSGEDRYGYNRIYTKNLNGYEFRRVANA
ncbi:chlorinating enzyme [Sphaerisporangium sp. TRM90804]|uniref:chlorinating enzyme n=1 Tax=Sphaerisporangium sp. TRM90804 TaxID=3031113 RepID=UPI00244B4D39|nr:chlorinating enzyme [Sphaerisporangium sp. TRM90804]MDH2426386.1 chlorinating enzyme [Sphaerisporangium sp. TRM90804]